MAGNCCGKKFVTLRHGANLPYNLNFENVGTAVNYCGIFISLAPGQIS